MCVLGGGGGYRDEQKRVALAQAAVRGKLQRARYLRLQEASKGKPLRYYALRIQVHYTKQQHSRSAHYTLYSSIIVLE